MKEYTGLLPTPQVFDATASHLKGKEYNYQNCHAEKLEQAMNRRLTSSPEDKYHKAVQAYEMGLSIQDLADNYGITRQAMWKILKRRGCRFRDNLRYGTENHFFRGTRASDKAQNLLEQAIEDGKIQRATSCEVCGRSGTFKNGRSMIQAHHPDYGKPLEVMWLCQKCHHEWHKANTAKEVMTTESVPQISNAQRIRALTFLRADSRNCVSPSLLPDSERERMTTVISGRRCYGSYEKLNRHGSSLRTLVASLLLGTGWYSRTVALTWKRKGTRFNRLLFQLAPSVRRTEGTGCGLLRTPDANMERGPRSEENLHDRYVVRKMPLCLNDQLAMLPTPKQRDYRSADLNEDSTRQQKDSELNTAIGKLCPTPRSSDYKGASKQTENKGRNPMTNSCMDAIENGTNRGLKLHSDFVSWMMGYPLDWMDV